MVSAGPEIRLEHSITKRISKVPIIISMVSPEKPVEIKTGYRTNTYTGITAHKATKIQSYQAIFFLLLLRNAGYRAKPSTKIIPT